MRHSNKNSTEEDDLADDYESIEAQEAAGECELTEGEELCMGLSAYLGMACILFSGCFFSYTEIYAAPDFEHQLYMTERYEKELADSNKIDCFRKGLPEYYKFKTMGEFKDAYHDKYGACK